jgi:hypothetical protein
MKFNNASPVLRKSFLLAILTVFFAVFIQFSPAAAGDDDPAYNPQRKPYSCFMRTLGNMTQGDLKDINAISTLLPKKSLDDNETSKLNGYGEMIYEKYKAEIDALIKDYYNIAGSKNPVPSEAQFAAARIGDKIIDFGYTRSLARAMIAVARYLQSEKRHEEALKLTFIVWRFGQIISNGDGGVPSLIMSMIGMAVKNIAAEGNFARSLTGGSFDAKFYDDFSAALLKANDDEMDMKAILNCERRTMINVFEYEVFIKNNKNPEYSNLLGRLSDSTLDESKKYTIGIFNDCYDSVAVWLTDHAAEPYIVKGLIEKQAAEISKNGQPTVWNFFNPSKAVGNILLAIAIPNSSRAYDQFLRAKLYPHGAAVLSKILSGVKKGGIVPRTINEIEEICGFKLPPDWFNDKKGAPAYKPAGDNFVLYSYGLNYADDNASEKDDIILFSIPKNYK